MSLCQNTFQNAPIAPFSREHICHLTPSLAMLTFQDQETSNSLKNDTRMTCLNMKLRSCPRVIYELDITEIKCRRGS